MSEKDESVVEIKQEIRDKGYQKQGAIMVPNIEIKCSSDCCFLDVGCCCYEGDGGECAVGFNSEWRTPGPKCPGPRKYKLVPVTGEEGGDE